MTAEVAARPTVLLRAEFKEGERRTPLPPAAAKELLAAGYQVLVEHSDNRAFTDQEYREAGCALVPSGSWRTAPKTTYILGLKELPEDNDALSHTHIYFGHAYKGQAGWQDLLGRFQRGSGLLLELEYLVDDKGRRVAAFGRPAGSVGAALGLLQWAAQQEGKPLAAPLTPWANEDAMIAAARAELSKIARKPRIVVVGALGRCGQGASHVLRGAGVEETNLTLWDLEETKKGGPFAELLGYDIVINCIYLLGPIPPFIDSATLASVGSNRKATVIVDVSCDTSNPHNPLPVYSRGTTLCHPVDRLATEPILDMIAIDHLPTLLPRESSVGFAKDLLPHVIALKDKSPVWTRAEATFHAKVALLHKKDD